MTSHSVTVSEIKKRKLLHLFLDTTTIFLYFGIVGLLIFQQETFLRISVIATAIEHGCASILTASNVLSDGRSVFN